MKRGTISHFLAVGGLALGALWQTGCVRSAPTHFYLLNAALPPVATAPAKSNVGLWVDPLPEYLRRPELLVRSGPNQVTYHDFQHWAEPLDQALPAILAQDLARALGQPAVWLYPWTSPTPPTRVFHVRVDRFDADPTGLVTLMASVATADTWQQHTITCQAESPTPASIVAAQSQALAQLAQAMAQP